MSFEATENAKRHKDVEKVVKEWNDTIPPKDSKYTRVVDLLYAVMRRYQSGYLDEIQLVTELGFIENSALGYLAKKEMAAWYVIRSKLLAVFLTAKQIKTLLL